MKKTQAAFVVAAVAVVVEWRLRVNAKAAVEVVLTFLAVLGSVSAAEFA
jgi:hypothetical protein